MVGSVTVLVSFVLSFESKGSCLMTATIVDRNTSNFVLGKYEQIFFSFAKINYYQLFYFSFFCQN